jgi:hypothetical protein
MNTKSAEKPLVQIPEKHKRLFWERVSKRGPDECWIWNGPTTGGKGYGRIKVFGKNRYAHRVSWIIHFGEIPAGMLVCHHYDTPTCQNPSHFFLGTFQDNHDDSVQKGRQRKACGGDHGHAKITDTDVKEIRRLRTTKTLTQTKIASRYGVSEATISNIVKRKVWAHVK